MNYREMFKKASPFATTTPILKSAGTPPDSGWMTLKISHEAQRVQTLDPRQKKP